MEWLIGMAVGLYATGLTQKAKLTEDHVPTFHTTYKSALSDGATLGEVASTRTLAIRKEAFENPRRWRQQTLDEQRRLSGRE